MHLTLFSYSPPTFDPSLPSRCYYPTFVLRFLQHIGLTLILTILGILLNFRVVFSKTPPFDGDIVVSVMYPLVAVYMLFMMWNDFLVSLWVSVEVKEWVWCIMEWLAVPCVWTICIWIIMHCADKSCVIIITMVFCYILLSVICHSYPFPPPSPIYPSDRTALRASPGRLQHPTRRSSHPGLATSKRVSPGQIGLGRPRPYCGFRPVRPEDTGLRSCHGDGWYKRGGYVQSTYEVGGCWIEGGIGHLKWVIRVWAWQAVFKPCLILKQLNTA